MLQDTRENFGKPGVIDYRNRNLAEVMKNLNLNQRFGMGIKWAKDSMAGNGNPPIEFYVESSHVSCILRKKPAVNGT